MIESEKCIGCGEPLPTDPAMASISHTIKPGAKLCTACGQRETLDLAWASGMKLGVQRAEAALEGGRELDKYLETKGESDES